MCDMSNFERPTTGIDYCIHVACDAVRVWNVFCSECLCSVKKYNEGNGQMGNGRVGIKGKLGKMVMWQAANWEYGEVGKRPRRMAPSDGQYDWHYDGQGLWNCGRVYEITWWYWRVMHQSCIEKWRIYGENDNISRSSCNNFNQEASSSTWWT
jgi:hypothetical protein